ncbi:MAG: cation-transporting P-type ATPase [Chloroflexi bacterium]|nr:cation-transporting P-type ATPase [Chloroflexota bacterium]
MMGHEYMGANHWHSLSIDDVLRQLGTRREGLTEEEAAERLQQYGRK